MNPKVAFQILYNLGFKAQKRSDNTADQLLTKVEPVDEWAQRVAKNEITDDEGNKVDIVDAVKQSIKDNVELKDYLKLVVNYVDSNPAILNENYGGKTDQSTGKNEPDEFGRK